MTARVELLALVGLASLASVNAQWGGTCSGGVDQDVANLQNNYPPILTPATIVAGDTVAQNLYNQILATNNPVLNYPPSQMINGNPTQPGYTAADPYCWWSYSNCVTPKIAGLIPDGVQCNSPMTWGLSFDDGPGCANTPLYATLEQHQQQATLFYIGSNLAQYPDQGRLGFNNGHQVCVHTWSHQYTTSLTNEQVFAEFYYAKKIIKDILGVSPRCWRPPFGDVDDRVRFIANSLEMWPIIWSADTNDWQADDPGGYTIAQQDYTNIINGNYGSIGTLPLSHELSATTVGLFTNYYPQILQRFDHVVGALSCFNITAPYAEQNSPIYQNFAQAAAAPTLQTLQAPAVAGTSGPIVWSGQVAYMASLNGTNIAPVVSSSSSALPAKTTTTAAAAAATTSQSSSNNNNPVFGDSGNTNSGSHVDLAAIIGGAVGGAALACIIFALVFCCRRRRRNDRQLGPRRPSTWQGIRLGSTEKLSSSPPLPYNEKFGHEQSSLLSPTGHSMHDSTSTLPTGVDLYNERRSSDVQQPYRDEPSPSFPPSPAATANAVQMPARARQSSTPGIQYINQS